MNMRSTIQFRTNSVGEAVFAASRQVWLASLGAAVVTRDWAKSEATEAFQSLVKEGTTVESRALRLLGNRFEASFALADSVWKQARASVQATVRDVAGTAGTLVRDNLPKSLSNVSLTSRLAARRKSVTTARAKSRSAKTVKAITRSGKRAPTK